MNQVVAFPPVTEELLQEAVQRILSVGSLEKIVLFGSRARGQARPDSDLDLLIIEESDLPRYRRAGRYRMALLGLFPAKDIVVWTPSEVALWRDVPNAFITAILAEGRVLYERSDRSGPRLAAQSL
jgi:predicted nucleotidyltransferase